MRGGRQGETVGCDRQRGNGTRRRRQARTDCLSAERRGATSGERRMVADGYAGKCKTKGRRPQRTSGPRDIRASDEIGATDGKGDGTRYNLGKAVAANPF